jgi:hypothetical protein
MEGTQISGSSVGCPRQEFASHLTSHQKAYASTLSLRNSLAPLLVCSSPASPPSFFARLVRTTTARSRAVSSLSPVLIGCCLLRCAVAMKLTIKDLQQKKFVIDVEPSATVTAPPSPSISHTATNCVCVDLASEAEDPGV